MSLKSASQLFAFDLSTYASGDEPPKNFGQHNEIDSSIKILQFSSVPERASQFELESRKVSNLENRSRKDVTQEAGKKERNTAMLKFEEIWGLPTSITCQAVRVAVFPELCLIGKLEKLDQAKVSELKRGRTVNAH